MTLVLLAMLGGAPSSRVSLVAEIARATVPLWPTCPA
jgi:hypothetical protein